MVLSRANVPHSGPSGEHKRLGEMLVEEGVITAQQLAEGLKHQQEHGGFLGQSLVALGFVSQDTIRQFVVKQFNIPHLNLLDYSINKQALELIPEEVCLRLKLLPIDKLGRILTVAMIDPLDEAALEEVRALCPSLRIKPILCDWDHFATVAERQFGSRPKKESSALGMLRETAPKPESSVATPPIDQEKGPASPTITRAPRARADEESPGPEMDVLVAETSRITIEPHRSTPEVPVAGVPSVDPEVLTTSLATAIRMAFRDALSELKPVLRSDAPGVETTVQAAPTPSAVEVLRPVLEAFHEQLAETFSSLSAEIREAVAEAVSTRSAEAEPRPESPVAPVTPPPMPDLDALRQAVADAVREGLAPLGESLNRLPAPAEPPGAAAGLEQTLEKLASGLETTVSGVISEAVGTLSAPIHQLMTLEAEKPQSPPMDLDAWARSTREAVSVAIRDAMDPLGETLRKTSESLTVMREQMAPPDWEQLAHGLREGVSTAVEEAMSAMLVRMKAALAERDKDQDQERQDMVVLAERLRDAVRDAMTAIENRQVSRETALAEAMREALETVAREARESHEAREDRLARLAETTLASLTDVKSDQTERQERLAQLAEAASQSAKQVAELLERHLIEEANRQDQVRRRKDRLASVAPFGGELPADAGAEQAWAEADEKMLAALESEQPLSTLTFDTFFPGTANAFTFKIAQAVAAAPGSEYNPLFLYGSVGTGKTHLVCAIGNAILRGKSKKETTARVGYVSASRFARRLAEAAAENALDAFRENYCHWDVLILDDIQFLGGRVEAQEEFFHIFNALHQQGRQIIIVADKAPDRLGMLEQRLVSRFASGIVAELKAPEWETRMKILRHRVAEMGVNVPEEVLGLIAMRVPGDVRKMTGALKKIAAFAKLVNQDLTVEMAQEMLNHLGAEAAA